MMLTIKFNNIIKFVIRRGKLIILTSIIFTLSFYLVNTLSENKQNEYEEITSTQTEKDYISEFSLMIEKPEKPDPIISITTVKSMIIGEDVQEKLRQLGIDINEEDLNKKLTLFVRNSKGEKIFFRISTPSEEMTKKLSNAYFDLITNKEIAYFIGKNVVVSTKPSLPTQDVPIYSDLRSSTDNSLMDINEPTNERVLSLFQIIVSGLGLGIVFGLVLALFADIIDKKIHSISYIKTSLDGEYKIYDATKSEKKSVFNRLSIYLESFSNKALVVSEKSKFVEEYLASENIGDVLLTNAIKKDQIQFSDNALVFVIKNKTAIRWLQDQIDILETTGKQFIIIFSDK